MQLLVCKSVEGKRGEKKKKMKEDFRGRLLRKAELVNSRPKRRVDVIGQPSQRRSTACFQRALNYASLSFHQAHAGRQIKRTHPPRCSPARCHGAGKINLSARIFVTRSTTQLKSDARLCQSSEIILMYAAC